MNDLVISIDADSFEDVIAQVEEFTAALDKLLKQPSLTVHCTPEQAQQMIAQSSEMVNHPELRKVKDPEVS